MPSPARAVTVDARLNDARRMSATSSVEDADVESAAKRRSMRGHSSDASCGENVDVDASTGANEDDDAEYPHLARGAMGRAGDDRDEGLVRCSTPLPVRLTMELNVEREQNASYSGVKFIARATVRGWKDERDDALEVSPVRGGITNALFKVKRVSDDETTVAGQTAVRMVVVRVFGKGTERFITHRKVQGETTHVLNEHGFGARVLGVFANGLVEEFIEADSIAPEELASGGALLRRVALQMRRLHKEVHPDLAPRVVRAGGMEHSRAHAIWDTLQLWFDLAYGVTKDHTVFKGDSAKRAALEGLKIDDEARRLLFEVVRERCDKVNSHTVYCHNDIHAGNFLINRQTDDLTLIDYEYADYGPRAFDMANLFCEFAGFECNYDQYPEHTLRREFYSSYLGVPSSSADVDSLEEEVAAWTPVTHAFWALWAVIQAKYSSIDFDFLGFADMRMKAFRSSAADASRWVPTNAAVGRGAGEYPQGWNVTAEGTL